MSRPRPPRSASASTRSRQRRTDEGGGRPGARARGRPVLGAKAISLPLVLYIPSGLTTADPHPSGLPTAPAPIPAVIPPLVSHIQSGLPTAPAPTPAVISPRGSHVRSGLPRSGLHYPRRGLAGAGFARRAEAGVPVIAQVTDSPVPGWVAAAWLGACSWGLLAAWLLGFRVCGLCVVVMRCTAVACMWKGEALFAVGVVVL